MKLKYSQLLQLAGKDIVDQLDRLEVDGGAFSRVANNDNPVFIYPA